MTLWPSLARVCRRTRPTETAGEVTFWRRSHDAPGCETEASDACFSRHGVARVRGRPRETHGMTHELYYKPDIYTAEGIVADTAAEFGLCAPHGAGRESESMTEKYENNENE